MTDVQPMFRCYYCKAEFCTEAGLRFHKAQVLEEHKPAKEHLWCKLHDKDYHSAKAYRLHMKQHHPMEQELHCPGCHQHFHRLGSVVAHMEGGQCTHITREDMLIRREDMMAFNERLGALNEMAALASGKLNINFEKYMIDPISTVVMTIRSSSQSAEALPATDTVLALEPYNGNSVPQSVAPMESDRDGPVVTDLPVGAEASNMNATQGSGWGSDVSVANASDHATIGTHTPDGNGSVMPQPSSPDDMKLWKVDDSGWWGNGKSTPDEDHDGGNTQAIGASAAAETAGTPFQPTSQALQTIPEVTEEVVIIDPNSPGYNAANFLNQESRKYDCPYDHCWKAFKTPEGLAIHLRNGICARPRYTCPACGHRFSSTTALTMHVEMTTRCPIRRTGFFRTLIDQLTAGIADIDGYHPDHTTRYTIQPLAPALLGPEPEEEPKTLEEQLHHTSEIIEWADRTFKERAASRAASVIGGPPVPEMRLEWA